MDLTPVYELRERLKAGAIAGAGLIGEDFRLKRALEAIAPLEAAAPVFLKLGQQTRRVLDPGCTDRAGALLDALTLADALLCTQGAVAAAGPVAPAVLNTSGAAVTNAPYSVLAPLIDALTSSGSGKYSFVMDTHKLQPELFQDYRVKNAMVSALGASYYELAQQVEQWLMEEDDSILPLLKQGFRPKGKKEMVRRLRVMQRVAGPKANDFYLSLLENEEVEKDIRAEAIFALHLCPENDERLVTLAKTERHDCKKMAYWALGRLDTPASNAFWETETAKKPEVVGAYATYSKQPHMSHFIAGSLSKLLAPYARNPEDRPDQEAVNKIQKLLYALPGKSGSEICAMYRLAASLEDALDDEKTKKKEQRQRYLIYEGNSLHKALPFSLAVPALLQHSILYNPTSDLLALAFELYKNHGERFVPPMLTAALLSKPAAEGYQLAEPYFHAKKLRNAHETHLYQVLSLLSWNMEEQIHQFSYHYSHPIGEAVMSCAVHTIYEPLDSRWYDALMHMEKEYDNILFALLPATDPAIIGRAAEHFYKRALIVQQNSDYLDYLDYLNQCGWTNCEGLLEAYCRHNGPPKNYWSMRHYIICMPGSVEDWVAEGMRVLQLMEDGAILAPSWNEAHFKRMRELLHELPTDTGLMRERATLLENRG